MKGLSNNTETVFEQISTMESVKNYTLIGGTALALQLEHRLSEDLDFCKWRKTKNTLVKIDNWQQIMNELSQIGRVEKNILDDNHIDFNVNGVKITFFADNEFKEPKELVKQPFLNNIKIADVKSIGIMKVALMLHRNSHRDYYDIYSILKNGISLNDIVLGATNYTGHRLKTKNIIAMLVDAKYVKPDKNFEALQPIYDFDLPFLEKEISEKVKELAGEIG
jgi:predicted nucleotidyltransferase component of viral defense system